MPIVVVVCCVSHNLCEKEKQQVPGSPGALEPPGNPPPPLSSALFIKQTEIPRQSGILLSVMWQTDLTWTDKDRQPFIREMHIWIVSHLIIVWCTKSVCVAVMYQPINHQHCEMGSQPHLCLVWNQKCEKCLESGIQNWHCWNCYYWKNNKRSRWEVILDEVDLYSNGTWATNSNPLPSSL